MSARVVMLGMPGAGKGTQAVRLAERLQVPAISTGEIFRANIGAHTELGEEVNRYISRGHLVPDEVTNALVFDRLAQADAAHGFLLDGYPRTVAQAQTLQDWLAQSDHSLDAVIELVADHDEVIDRLLARAHIENRADDDERVVRQRLEVYERQTRPLTDFYAARDLLVQVDGVGRIEEVTERMLTLLADHEGARARAAKAGATASNEPHQ